MSLELVFLSLTCYLSPVRIKFQFQERKLGKNLMIFLCACNKYARGGGHLFFRTFSILFVIVYFAPLLFAAEIFIPFHLAQIRDRSEGTNGKTVVIVEEAHVDYGAQKAIAAILQDLAENESLRDIFVEGGWGDVSLTPLRSLTGPERRKEVAKEYLRQGKISGDEYLSLATDLDLRLRGIEDPKLYEANMNIFLQFSEVRSKLLNELKQLDPQIQNLQPKVLMPAMLKIMTMRREFEDQKISLLDYAQFLMSKMGAFILSEKSSVPGVARFPHLAKIVALSGGNGTYDPDKLAVEKKSVVRFLSQNLTKPELEDILALEDQKTAEGELVFLEALLKKARDLSKAESLSPPKNLISYRNILRGIVLMDTAAIFPELEHASQAVFLAEKPSAEQVAFMETVRGIGTLEKLFDLRLTEDEFVALEQKNGDSHFLKKNDCPRLDFLDTQEFEKWIPVALSFYETARIREKAMIENLDHEIEDRDLKLAALVAGGFHSRNIFDALKKRGYTVVLIFPRFAPSDDRA